VVLLTELAEPVKMPVILVTAGLEPPGPGHQQMRCILGFSIAYLREMSAIINTAPTN